MAKEYIQDILPPGESPKKIIPTSAAPEHEEVAHSSEKGDDGSLSRGIRSIQPPVRSRPINRMPIAQVRPQSDAHFNENEEGSTHEPRSGASRWWIWAVAVVALLIVAGAVILSIRPTTVSVVPKTRSISLSETLLMAAPETAPIPGVPLTYTIRSFDIEDSEVIAAQGTRHVESKASGSITVFNEFSSSPVKLIKNTRFETPDGLIYRAPADVVVPGTRGSTPGQIAVTVVADAPGEKYNVGPVSRFTLPGLKSGEMYTKVYARSTQPMTGGLVGEEPATAPGVLTAAISGIRSRLAAKAQEMVIAEAAGSSDVILFPGLAQIGYSPLPSTSEGTSTVRIHQKAHIEVPQFTKDAFAMSVAQAQAEDVQPGSVVLLPGPDFGARVATSSIITYGTDPVSFVIAGQAQLVWNVDSAALSAALAGRDADAFQTIVDGFAGIQEARARIVPPWKKVFPAAAENIKIVVTGGTE